MEKDYGYKNISNKNEMEQASANDGKHEYGYDSGKFISYNGFVNWGKQNKWGSEGQTRYKIKTLEDLLGANKNIGEVNP